MPVINGVGWFEIGAEEPAATERFYGDLFGWTFADDPATDDYRTVSIGEAGPQGGVYATGGKFPSYAVFMLLVADVADTCRRAEEGGGKVLAGPSRNRNGLTYAHLSDPAGNQFGVFTPPGN
jgi:predicted enzyme related to lactoylglutathione lyase